MSRMQLCRSASFLGLVFLVSTISIPFPPDVESLKMSANIGSSDSASFDPGYVLVSNIKCAMVNTDYESPGTLPQVLPVFQIRSLERPRRFISPSVLFDNFYSIDNRGNTRHYVDDSASIAKVAYPVGNVLRTHLRSSLHILKFTLQFGINIAQIM
ncbi:hypothetical protein RvY_07795 [Ramazzottius varieornatus]|uniref:Uncharacterized protein n=1 Tax=Ramazzottius varieornatus TaxID=947166 RepID=A0A1D1V6E3_RAMVA|nr:hypothetical protein RvY_07795 [Ramazzottius varieornatus]